MQIIRRRTDLIEEQHLELELVGFNSNGVLTLKLKWDINDILINIKGEELNKLKRFLKQIGDKNE